MAKIQLKEEFILRVGDTEPVKYNLEKEEHCFSYFACTCDDEDKKYWKDKINDYMPNFDPEKHADIVSQLVMEINHCYHGSVSIDSDMWFGVSTSCHIWNKDFTEYELVNIFMQCDEVSIGLMAIIEILRKVVLDEEN